MKWMQQQNVTELNHLCYGLKPFVEVHAFMKVVSKNDIANMS